MSPTLEDLLALQRQLIQGERGLTNTSADPNKNIRPDTHFYVVAFNGGLKGPRIIRSGVYVSKADNTGEMWGSNRPDANLVNIRWDGDQELSPHPVNRIGICIADDGVIMLLAVASLDDLGPYPLVDERPLKQHEAHRIDLNPPKEANNPTSE